MSMTKNSAAFDRMMEEARRDEENSYLLYQEERYLRERQTHTTNDTQAKYTINQPKGTNHK